MRNQLMVAIFVAMGATLVTGLIAIPVIEQQSAIAGRTTTTSCTTQGGQPKECGTPPANCLTATEKAGSGKGKGEIKGTSC